MRKPRIEKCLIYGLVDPTDLLVRYVGLSSSGMERPKSHTQPHNLNLKTYCASWIRGLAARGSIPLIVVLELCSKEQLCAQERWWIAFGRACGWSLTNLTDGGDRPSHTPELRAKMSAVRKGKPGKPHSMETRTKIGAAQIGKFVASPSLETRAKISAANKGKLLGDANPAKRPEVREKISASSTGIQRIRTPGHNAKIAAAHLGRPKHTTITKERLRAIALARPPMSSEARAKCAAASRRRWGST